VFVSVDKDLLVVIKSSRFEAEEPDLGSKLNKAFLTQLLESGCIPSTMIFMADGIFLTTEGSEVLDVLRQFENAGSKISSCGTCLDYYGRRDMLEIGEAGNMQDTVQALLSHQKVMRP